MDNDYNLHLNINAEIYDKFKKILKDNNVSIGGQSSKLKKITSKLLENSIKNYEIGKSSDEPYILKSEYDKLKFFLNEIKEIYIGMDGFSPETAPEAYLQFILNQIYDLAIK